MKSTPFRLAAVLAASALALSACGSEDSESDSGSDDGEAAEGGGDSSEGVTIGIKFDQPGLGLKEGDSYSGMDVDVAKAVVEEMGMSESDITWKESPSAQRETLLETGQVDMVFATYSITDERKEKVQFAGPYFTAGQSLLVAADSDITGTEDLDGQVLCSVTGSTSAPNVKEEVPGVQLQEYGTYSECVSQLANGTIQAVTTDDAILAGFAAQEQYAGQLMVVGDTFSEERYGVGLPKDADTCEDVNGIVEGLWEDGTMDTIIADNLGDDYEVNSEMNPPEFGGDCG
ncbi:MAG: glutamate ABC transporter substrate-binding protein [Ornithinimicrobium sp.]